MKQKLPTTKNQNPKKNIVYLSTIYVCKEIIQKKKKKYSKTTLNTVSVLHCSELGFPEVPTPNVRFVERLFMAIFKLLAELWPEICWEEVAKEIFFFVLISDLGFEPWTYEKLYPECRVIPLLSILPFLFLLLLPTYIHNWPLRRIVTQTHIYIELVISKPTTTSVWVWNR